MKFFLVTVPLFNSEMVVEASCMRFEKAENLLLTDQMPNAYDNIMNSKCLEILNAVGIDAFSGGVPIFVPLNHLQVLAELDSQCNVPREMVIFLLDGDVPPTREYIDSIRKFKEMGYRFAFENIKDYVAMEPLLRLADFIFLDVGNEEYLRVRSRLSRKFSDCEFIAANISDMVSFRNIKNVDFKYFGGYFYTLPVTRGAKSISPLKANAIRLLNLLQEDDFEISDVAAIVKQDTSMSISLLRLVNSPYLGLSTKIKSIAHAVTMLGQREVKKWITAAVANTMGADKPSEITKLSLVRAKFAENLAETFGLATHSASLFLMGLFSILDVVLEIPMADALRNIRVTEEISDALIEQAGIYSNVMELIRYYEKGDWHNTSLLLIKKDLQPDNIYDAYLNAVQWYGMLLSTDVEDDDLGD